MTELNSGGMIRPCKNLQADLPSWNQSLPWTYLEGRTLERIYPNEGKLLFDNNETLYLGEFGALIFLDKLPQTAKVSCDLAKFEDESGRFNKIYIDEIHASFPPKKIGNDGKEQLDYQKINLASIATLYSYPKTYVIPERYILRANILDTPKTVSFERPR
jgi:hypothetical protein